MTKKSMENCNLENFETFLLSQGKSRNTIRMYRYAVRQYFTRWGSLNAENLRLHKLCLLERYKPQTVNQRIRALNCYLEYCSQPMPPLSMVRIQRRTCLDHMVSQGDYQYLKRRLLEDQEFTYYFIVWVLAATGIRVSELVCLEAPDAFRGFRDICSKGSKIRRIYFPSVLSEELIQWLKQEGRLTGPMFLNRFGNAITPGGIRFQLKALAQRYHLDPVVMHPHAFRHLFARSFLDQSGDLSLLSDLLGHESIETTRIYLQRTYSQQQQIVDQVVCW